MVGRGTPRQASCSRTTAFALKRMSLPNEAKILAAFALGLVLFGTAAAFSHRNSLQVTIQHDAIAQTQTSLKLLDEVKTTVSRAEESARIYREAGSEAA